MSSSDLDRRTSGDPDVDADAIPTLELEDVARESEAALVARGAAYAKEYSRVQGQATTLLKNLAVTQVALRIQYDDMRGSTGAYRAVVADMYRSLGMDAERITQMQASVRWHISNILRRHMTPRELEKNNLQPTSALERLQDARAVNSVIIAASKTMSAVDESTPRAARKRTAARPAEAGQPVRATADHLRLAEVAANILGKFDSNVIKRDMTDGQRAKLDAELAKMQRKLASLRKLTQKPRSGA